MLDKQVQFQGKTDTGIYCQTLFGSSGSFEKVAGAPAFSDLETGEKLRKFLSGISKEERKKYQYVLVNALGAGEYFGSNINADYFPWDALCHEGRDYGYQTFLDAHAFAHHVNKDPSRAFGQPVLSLLNSSMKRVELVVRLDREKSKVEGHDGILTRIDNGEFPDVSMGCRVPYDVCSICGNRAKTRLDYCVHMLPTSELRHVYGPNRIISTGQRIYVINLHPKFFDISFVFIGADKTAKVMSKLASKGSYTCLGDVCVIPKLSSEVEALSRPFASVSTGSLQKTASAPSCSCDCGGACEGDLRGAFKTASQKKLSEIIKSVPGNIFSTQKLPQVEKAEPDLSSESLDELSQFPLSKVLSSALAVGMLLKPREFQQIVLHRMDEDGLARELAHRNAVFRPVLDVDDCIPLEPEGSDDILSKLRSILPMRTAFGPRFRVRITVMAPSKKIPLPSQTSIEHPLLDKISAAYNGYRQRAMMKLSQAVEVVESNPKVRMEVLGGSLVDAFTKTSSAPILTPDTLAYMMGAYLTERGMLTNSAAVDAVALNNKWLLDFENHGAA